MRAGHKRHALVDSDGRGLSPHERKSCAACPDRVGLISISSACLPTMRSSAAILASTGVQKQPSAAVSLTLRLVLDVPCSDLVSKLGSLPLAHRAQEYLS